VLFTFRRTAALQYLATGEPKSALTLYLKIASDGETSGEKGTLFNAYGKIAGIYLSIGDFEHAQQYVQKSQTLWKSAASIRGHDSHAKGRESFVEESR